jgi:hypothetical protein
VLFAASPASALTVDPGPAGSSFTYGTFDLPGLAGVPLDGQTVSFTIGFGDGVFLVDRAVGVNLFLNQSGPLGAYPSQPYAASGALLGRDGGFASAYGPVALAGRMPAQIWPGWPYTLDGQPLLPATTAFELRMAGAPIGFTTEPGAVYYIDPVVFSGLRFDVQLPDADATLLGGRLSLWNFESPLLVSPDPLPQYRVQVADGDLTTAALLAVGLVTLALARRCAPAGRA